MYNDLFYKTFRFNRIYKFAELNHYETGTYTIWHLTFNQLRLIKRNIKFNTILIFKRNVDDTVKLLRIDNLDVPLIVNHPVRIYKDFPELVVIKGHDTEKYLAFIIKIREDLYVYAYDYDFNLLDFVKIPASKFLFSNITQFGEIAVSVKSKDQYKVIIYDPIKNKFREINDAIYFKKLFKIRNGNVPEIQGLAYIKKSTDRVDLIDKNTNEILDVYPILDDKYNLLIQENEILFGIWDNWKNEMFLVSENALVKLQKKYKKFFLNIKYPSFNAKAIYLKAPENVLKKVISKYTLTEEEVYKLLSYVLHNKKDIKQFLSDFIQHFLINSMGLKADIKEMFASYIYPTIIIDNLSFFIWQYCIDDKNLILNLFANFYSQFPIILLDKYLYQNSQWQKVSKIIFTEELKKILNNIFIPKGQNFIDLRKIFNNLSGYDKLVINYLLSMVVSSIKFDNFKREKNKTVIYSPNNVPVIISQFGNATRLNVREFQILLYDMIIDNMNDVSKFI